MSIVRSDKKIPAGILAILLGYTGVHKFFLGYPRAGVAMLSIYAAAWLLALIGFGPAHLVIWAMHAIGVIEGVIYLTRSDTDFYRDYIIGRKPWF
jgi:TM2 domain-containing membrane protein YozV